MLHSHKYQRERKCFMALPHNPVNRMCYQSKLIFLQIWPHNEAEQTQRWVSSTTGPFSLGECKGSFISSPTTADILAAWDIEKIPFIVKMTKGSEGLTSRWMGTVNCLWSWLRDSQHFQKIAFCCHARASGSQPGFLQSWLGARAIITPSPLTLWPFSMLSSYLHAQEKSQSASQSKRTLPIPRFFLERSKLVDRAWVGTAQKSTV